MRFELRLERRAGKALRNLAEPDRSRVVSVLEALQDDPFSGDVKALSGSWRGFFRRRVGDYRILYAVDTEVRVVSVQSVSHRKDAY